MDKIKIRYGDEEIQNQGLRIAVFFIMFIIIITLPLWLLTHFVMRIIGWRGLIQKDKAGSYHFYFFTEETFQT